MLMLLPDIHKENINNFLNKTEIIQETIQQIMKDFSMFGIVITFSGTLENAYQELKEQLTFHIDDLIKHDYNKLLAVLYRIDITEKTFLSSEKELSTTNLADLIAHQLIVRELKKVLTRRYFKEKLS